MCITIQLTYKKGDIRTNTYFIYCSVLQPMVEGNEIHTCKCNWNYCRKTIPKYHQPVYIGVSWITHNCYCWYVCDSYGYTNRNLQNNIFERFWLILFSVYSVASLGGAARPGCHHFGVTPFVCFFSLEPENPLIGRQRPLFFLVITYFGTENQLVLQRRPFLFFFFFFGLHLYFGRYRVPPPNSAPGAIILSDASAVYSYRLSFIVCLVAVKRRNAQELSLWNINNSVVVESYGNHLLNVLQCE